VLALALAVVALLPTKGVLVPAQSLAGVRLGDTPAEVRAQVGRHYSVCRSCDAPSWFYFASRGFSGAESGLGVTFRSGRVVAVYTLGVARGWRSTSGIRVGDEQARLARSLRLTPCIGFTAHSVRGPRSVTTYFTQEQRVSGFALTRPSETVCR
jgi:hypothetical protein